MHNVSMIEFDRDKKLLSFTTPDLASSYRKVVVEFDDSTEKQANWIFDRFLVWLGDPELTDIFDFNSKVAKAKEWEEKGWING